MGRRGVRGSEGNRANRKESEVEVVMGWRDGRQR